ncbi:hypothetical protein SRABI106_03491 [Rahnella aquatilis]|nr:hypothetical protein SRABI106_03491 [Rahnella aquatilis]
MILRDFADFTAGTFQKCIIVLAGTDADNHQNQCAKQRQQCFFAGDHHHRRAAKLAERIQRDQPFQVMRDLHRVRNADGADVCHPEQITVGGVMYVIQRLHQLAVCHFQLGQFKNLGIATREQGIEQITLRPQLRIQNFLLICGERFAIVLPRLTVNSLLIQQIFIVQTLNAQLAHIAVKLLRFWPIRQTRNLRPQGFAK